jgi:hypothetical protein
MFKSVCTSSSVDEVDCDFCYFNDFPPVLFEEAFSLLGSGDFEEELFAIP